MKVSLKRSELPGMYGAINANLKAFTGAKLTYAIAKNLRTLKAEVDLVNETRINLCKSWASKDEDGEPMTEGDQFVIPDEEGFEEEIQKLFSEDTDLELHAVKQEDLNDELTGDLVSLILPFVE